ncbi:hypothetical protein RFI_21174, partial [Reticulomyxa filosa]
NNNNNEANEKYEKSKRLLLAHGKNDPATTTTTTTMTTMTTTTTTTTTAVAAAAAAAAATAAAAEMLLYDEDVMQSLREHKEKMERNWQLIQTWHEQISQYICNRQFNEAVDLMINAPLMKKHYAYSGNGRGDRLFEHQQENDHKSQQQVYASLFNFHRNTLRTLLEQQLQAFTSISTRANNHAWGRNPNSRSANNDESGRGGGGGGGGGGGNRGGDVSIATTGFGMGGIGAGGVEIRRKELTLHLMKLGYVDKAMKLLLLFKSKQLKQAIREIVMSGDIEKYIKNLCDIFFMHVIRTADEYANMIQEFHSMARFAHDEQLQHTHQRNFTKCWCQCWHWHWSQYTIPSTTAADMLSTKNVEAQKAQNNDANNAGESALEKWIYLDWINSVQEKKNNSGGGNLGDEDSDDDDGNRDGDAHENDYTNAHMSALVVWMCQELNRFIDLFERQVFVFLDKNTPPLATA